MSGGIAAIAVLAAVIFRLVDQDQAVRVSCRGVRPEIRDSRSAPQAESAAAPVRSDIAALPGSGSGSSPSRFPTVAYPEYCMKFPILRKMLFLSLQLVSS